MSGDRTTSSTFGSWLLVAGLCVVFFAERIYGAGATRDAVGLLGGLLLAVAVVLRARAYGAATDDVRGVEARLLGCYGGVALALGCYALSTPWGASALGLEAATADRATGVLSVMWPAVLLTSLMGLLFIELVYARMPVARSVELRRVRTSLHAGLSLGLAVIFLLSINYVAVERDVRKDVSYFKTTEPSEGTRAMVGQLDAPIRALLFYQDSSDVLDRVRPYFAALEAATSGKLQVEVLDVALAPDLARRHKITDNGHVLLVQGEGEQEKGEFFRVGTQLTEARRVLKQLDGAFQESFRKLVRPERVLFLTVGHGERNAKSSELAAGDRTSAMEDILQRLNLKTQNIGVSEGLGNAVPDGASAVVVIGPSKPFLPEEVTALLTYVRKGGRLMLMLDPDIDAGEIGLEPLLAGLGLAQEPGVLTSDKNYMRRTHNVSDRAVVFSNAYNSHPAVTTANRHQREVATVFYRGAAFKKAEGAAEGAPRVVFPLRSAPDAWLDQNSDFSRDESEAAGAKMMVAASVLKGAPAPDKAASADGKADDAVEGRALVIGDGDFITDKLAANGGNVLVFVDGLAWLIGHEELGGEVSSEDDIAIEHTSEDDKIWFYGTTFAAPLPVALLGVWIARRRRRRGEVGAS